eukprot:TRINITY_DN2995_c0_g1_i1.p1 TRINITY_DN2995_c0_g1~~TRINITY_DN2995_c0_g1_i1.p1  ORF type:complete len:567 (-),score=126.72 TRINITY_DN2995_c0_g1_i1:1160-2860(-)
MLESRYLLAIDIINDEFGKDHSKLIENLIMQPNQTFGELCQNLDISKPLLKDLLTVLIQHNCVVYVEMEIKGKPKKMVRYSVNLHSILLRKRFAEVLNFLTNYLPSKTLYSGNPSSLDIAIELITQIYIEGKVYKNNIIEKISTGMAQIAAINNQTFSATKIQVNQIFEDLTKEGFIKPKNPLITFQTDEDEDSQKRLRTHSVSRLNKLNDMPRLAAPTFVDSTSENLAAILNINDYSKEAEKELDDQLSLDDKLWSVDHICFLQRFRHQRLVSFLRDSFDSFTAGIISSMLTVGKFSEDSVQKSNQTQEESDRLEQLKLLMMKGSSDKKRLISNVRTYNVHLSEERAPAKTHLLSDVLSLGPVPLIEICNGLPTELSKSRSKEAIISKVRDTLITLSNRPNSFIVVHDDDSFSLLFNDLSIEIRKEELLGIIYSQLSPLAMRIFRILLDIPLISQQSIADRALAPLKEVREALYELSNFGYITNMEISKATDHDPKRTFFLYSAHFEEAVVPVIERLYHSYRNLRRRSINLHNEPDTANEKQIAISRLDFAMAKIDEAILTLECF